MKKLGKHEIKARRQEYQTALNLLTTIKEHVKNNDLGRIRAYVEVWEKTYTEWLENLVQDELKEQRNKNIIKLMRGE